MSGFEVIGLVLGTIPLVISALEHYQEGLQAVRRWRSYEAELQSLKRSLGNENAIFINTCQQLLSGVVSSIEHEKLVDEPFGELWSNTQIRDQVALRLDHVYETFRATVEAMGDALREIKEKLGLDERGKVKWTEGKAIAKELKRATFTVNRAHFDGLLANISKNNQDLKTLTNQSIQLEPERRVKHHGRLFSQLKEALHSIYGAIRRSLACDCPDTHQVSLRLAKPKLTPRNEESQILRNSNFQCAVSYRMDNASPPHIQDLWSLIVLRVHESSPKAPDKTPPRTPSLRKGYTVDGTIAPSPIRMSQLEKKFRSVRFSEETVSSSETDSLLYSVKAIVSTPHPAAAVLAPIAAEFAKAPAQELDVEDPVNLCKLVRKEKCRRSAECIGLVSNSTSERYPKFGVYLQSEHEERRSMISLRTVLEDCESNFPNISYADGLKLAVDISSGVLQLINTSWLSGKITSQDIMFPVENGRPLYNQAFLAKTILDPEQKFPVLDQGLRLQILRKLLFSLGMLLLEILFCETLDHAWDTKMESGPSKALGQFSDRRAAAELLNQVQTLSSPKFYSAVRRFLFCEFTCLDVASGDEAFCKEVYGKTIALMEEDFHLSQSLW